MYPKLGYARNKMLTYSSAWHGSLFLLGKLEMTVATGFGSASPAATPQLDVAEAVR